MRFEEVRGRFEEVRGRFEEGSRIFEEGSRRVGLWFETVPYVYHASEWSHMLNCAQTDATIPKYAPIHTSLHINTSMWCYCMQYSMTAFPEPDTR